jgi:novobiocin biosynthesis protein NovU/D-mycarose 3-C-methyltransferase
MNRDLCGGCGSFRLRPVLDLGDSPLADDFPHTADEVQIRYPLGLVQCLACSLIQLTEVVDDEVLWGGDYGFYAGSSWVAAQWQEAYAKEVLNLYPDLSRDFTVEIASNDGTLIRHLDAAGCRVLGIDPAKGPSAVAKDLGLDVLVEGFSAATARKVVAEHGQAGVVIANNVVAHVTDLTDFLAGIALLLRADGVGFLEFQYAADLVTGNQFDNVYHEHRFFFSASSFAAALMQHDLRLVSVRQIKPQGGSLRVVLAHTASKHRTDGSVTALLAEELWLRDENALAGFQGRAGRVRSRLLELLHEQKAAGKRVAGYGASAKFTTLANFTGLSTDLVQYVVDATPMKHGRYVPGTGIPIIDPRSDSRAPDCYLLGIHNYAGAVIRRERESKTFDGTWIVPIPLPVLL